MAESDFQRKPLFYAVDALDLYFQDRPDVYVSGNLFIYYEEGNPEAVVAPDVFAVFGAPKHDRSTYLLWNEPKAPDFVLEITSRSTRSKDRGPKRGTYALLGVREYMQYDPTQDYLRPPLQGFRLVGENYEPMPSTALPDGTLVLSSAVLGLNLRLENGVLRFFDPATGHYLLSYREAEYARREAEQARREAEERARQEASALQAAEARIAELEARLRALQSQGQAGQEPSSSL
jgi:Uma2 family endonuclease